MHLDLALQRRRDVQAEDHFGTPWDPVRDESHFVKLVGMSRGEDVGSQSSLIRNRYHVAMHEDSIAFWE